MYRHCILKIWVTTTPAFSSYETKCSTDFCQKCQKYRFFEILGKVTLFFGDLVEFLWHQAVRYLSSSTWRRPRNSKWAPSFWVSEQHWILSKKLKKKNSQSASILVSTNAKWRAESENRNILAVRSKMPLHEARRPLSLIPFTVSFRGLNNLS